MHQDVAHDRLTSYLIDVHALEEQSLQQLERAPDIAGEPELARILRDHLEETREQQRRIEALLAAREASPSRARDLVMRAGGQGFVLFARSQVDTPGKLAAHAYSYEALEWAAYEVLARTAERAGEGEVARVAIEIRDQERSMMERIADLFGRTVEASLERGPDRSPSEKLGTYLADAHAIEAQSLQLLSSGDRMIESATWKALFERHHAETRRQQAALEERLEAIGEHRSVLKDAALRFGALNWGMFFQAQPDTAPKLAAFAYAFEHLEIGGYEQLRRVAERAGDAETARVVEEILGQERRAAKDFADALGEALDASLR